MGLLSGLAKKFPKLGKAGKTLMPFGGRMLGLDSEDRKKMSPQQQYFGGSAEASKESRDRFKAGANAGDLEVAAGIKRADVAAGQATDDYRGMRDDAVARQQLLGRQADAGYARADTNQGKLEAIADNAPRDYQRTAQLQFQGQQDANQNQALALGSTGGAGGLRTALASSTQANAQAANQAQITQAQEYNQLKGMQAGIYGQSAELSAQREQAARQNQLAQQGVQGNAIAGAYGAQANTANMQVGAGTAERGQNIGAEVAQGQAELGAAREYEGQRQQNEKYNYTQDWFPLKRFNAPA